MKKSNAIRQLWAYVRNNRIYFILSVIFSLISVASTLYIPILTGQAVDILLAEGQVNFEILIPMLIRMAATVLVTFLSQYFSGLCNNRLSYQAAMDIRNDLFSHMQRLPLLWLDSHPAGDIISRMITDVDQLTDGLLISFTQFLTGSLTIIGTLVMMFLTGPVVALVVAGLTPVSMLVSAFIAKRSHKLFAEQTQIRGEQTAFIHEMTQAQELIHAFGREEQVQRQFDDVNDRLGACSRKATFISSLTNPSTRFVNALVYAGVCLSGALLVLGGGLTVGALTTMLSYATRYAKPFNEISGVLTELQGSLACADRVFSLMAEPCESPDPQAVLQEGSGNVDVEKLYFSYTPGTPFLRDISLEARSGMKIAIVGPTGCGKTTLINLMMRFFDPEKGNIRIDGQNIASVSRESLRSRYGMVLQDTWIKQGTVRENLLMADSSISDEEMIHATKRTQAHSFICRLPLGYDTPLGEGNISLSEGQKQLICITRALLASPRILLLDEATSFLDTLTESKVQQAFDELMKERTSFVVAHRLSTIRNADLILVMNKGMIEEKGTHEELLAKGGLYAQLYYSQFEAH